MDQSTKNTLNNLNHADGSPPLLCICGGSASGKTHFVNGLVRQLESIGLTALSLHCDNYYRSRYKPDPITGFDTINAIDTEALLADLQAAREGTLTHLRHYDMSSRVVVYRPIGESCLTAGYDLIVVEGAYGPQAILPRVLIAVVVYLETPLWRRIWRRLCRDVRERGRSPISVLHQTFWQMLPGERRFIVPLRQQAHVVVRDPVEGCRAVLARITSHG
ncbi:uridine kinase [Synechococcus sp. BL107]|uniref:uridine kinase family protein n=1 Tax=Synechococcus sp. BL107 TaxID=313625 RepID=UPI00350F7C3D